MPQFAHACSELRKIEAELETAETRLGEINARRIEHQEAPFKLSAAKSALKEVRAQDIVAGITDAVHPTEEKALQSASDFADHASALDRAHEIQTTKIADLKAKLADQNAKFNAALQAKLSGVAEPIRRRLESGFAAIEADAALLAAIDQACGAPSVSMKGLPTFLTTLAKPADVGVKAKSIRARAMAGDLVTIRVWSKSLEANVPGRNPIKFSVQTGQALLNSSNLVEDPGQLFGVDMSSLGGTLHNLSDGALTTFAEKQSGKALEGMLVEIRRLG